MPTTRVPALDYTSRDRDAIINDSKSAISFYTPEWTDQNNTDFGVVLLNVLAGHLDVLHFYIDRMAAESYITTAVKRESVIKLLRLINFTLRSIVPATADITFSLAQVLSDDVVIPVGTQVQTVSAEGQEPITFETTAALTITAGNLTGTAGAAEGTSDEEDLDDSIGQAFQSFPVVATTIVEDSLDLYINEGSGEVLWTEVASFVDSDPTDTVYRIERDEDEKITVFTGDGLQGKIPVATATLRATFRVITGDRGGAGVNGNVGANTITILLSTILVGGRTVTITVNNAAQASGGEARQSIEEAKRLGPASLLTLGRAVTAADYKTIVEQIGGVAKARVTQGTPNDPCCACSLEIFVAPAGGGNASQALKDTILAELEDKKMVGTGIEIADPTYVSVDVTGTVYYLSSADPDTIQNDTNTAVDAFFDLEGTFIEFGQDVYLGNLFSEMESVSNIDHVDLVKVTRVPVPILVQWTGDATFSAITTGTASQDETWTATFITPTTFSVIGSVSGIQANGTLSTAYTTDLGEAGFTIQAGSSPHVAGDRATFKTSSQVGNVPIDSSEIPQKGTATLTFVAVPSTTAADSCA